MNPTSRSFQEIVLGLRERDSGTFKLLHSHQRLLELRNALGETPLHYLAIEGETDAVEWLIHAGANINPINDFQRTPLMEVAIKGDFEMAKTLVSRGADVDIQTDDGETAALLACELKHFDIARYLVAHGASPSACNILDRSVADYLNDAS